MAEVIGIVPGAERFPAPARSTPICDGLIRIKALLEDALPKGASVTFSYDGQLQVHIDVRNREDVIVVEMLLPTIESGVFRGIGHSGTPGRSFRHRITAQVDA